MTVTLAKKFSFVTAPLLLLVTPLLPSSPAESRSRPGETPLTLDEPTAIELRSHGVGWQGNTFHLVKAGQITFTLNDDRRLRARLDASLTCFDEVDHVLHAAVYDEEGALLGTARVDVYVPRVWVGEVLTLFRELELDFGISEAYPRAASFALAVSEREVTTPDSWQK